MQTPCCAKRPSQGVAHLAAQIAAEDAVDKGCLGEAVGGIGLELGGLPHTHAQTHNDQTQLLCAAVYILSRATHPEAVGMQCLDKVDEQLVGILLPPHAELPVERLEVASTPIQHHHHTAHSTRQSCLCLPYVRHTPSHRSVHLYPGVPPIQSMSPRCYTAFVCRSPTTPPSASLPLLSGWPKALT